MDAHQQNGVEDSAVSQIASMFQRPSQLEKIDELLKKAERKKAMLRTGVQSQLEGIRLAISHLQVVGEEVKHIDKSMQEIFARLQSIPSARIKLKELSKANSQHSQYAIAMDNIKHICNLADTNEKTHDFILDGKLLLAHKNVMELENARDDLMFEVHKLNSERREYDKNLLKTYFSDVDKLVDALGKQIWYICSRALEAVQGNDSALQQLVSALRIIEREERIDTYYLDQRLMSNNFMPPGRPRQWRQRLFEVLLKNVHDRLEGNQLEDKAINRQWLARYLEACRRRVVDDLRLVKTSLSACFPPEYNIYDRYIKYYHDSISLHKLASDALEKNELVQLLSWIQSYTGEQMLGHPKLGIQAQALLQEFPLLPKSTTNHLHDRFIEMTRRDMHEWLDKTLMQEKDDWYKQVPPETDSNKFYYTQLPSILFGMVEDTVSLSKEISQEIVPRAIDVAVDEFIIFSGKYKEAATAYKGKHFEDRSHFQSYTSTKIAIANNLDICVESTDKLEKHIRLTMESGALDGASSPEPSGGVSSARSIGFSVINRQELIGKMEQLKKKWQFGIQFAVTALIEEVVEDVQKHMEQLLTRTWLLGSADLDTICITLADYYRDYRHLRVGTRFTLLNELLFKLISEFIIGLETRRLTFSKYEERHLAAERIKADAKRVEQQFATFFEDPDYPMPTISAVLLAVAEVLDLRDKTLLSLEVSTMMRKFPDIPAEFLTALLQIREDIGRSEAKNIAEEALNNTRYHSRGDPQVRRLFQLCKSGAGGGARRALPALESTSILASVAPQTNSQTIPFIPPLCSLD
uniref:Exocyst complex component 3 n=1 Tax=Globodera rostochiensis TaxID=31243 RepID=A0A914I8A8_GLORO